MDKNHLFFFFAWSATIPHERLLTGVGYLVARGFEELILLSPGLRFALSTEPSAMAALLYRSIAMPGSPMADGSQRAVKLSILCLVMAVIAGILVAIRFVGRYLKRSIGADDWTILAAFV